MLPQIWHLNFLHLFLNEFLYRQFRSIGYYSDRKGGGVQSITISLLRSRGRYTVLVLLSKTNIFVIFFSAIADGSHLIFSAQSQSVVPNYTLHLYNTYSTPVQHLLYTCTTPTLHLYNTYSTLVQRLLYTCTTPTLHLYNILLALAHSSLVVIGVIIYWILPKQIIND